MLQVIQHQKTGEIRVEDLPDIKCPDNGILVKNYYSVISAGTERTSVETAKASLLGKAKSRPDLVKQVIDNIKKEGFIATYEKVMNRLDNYKELGYSSTGIVKESKVSEFRAGDRVACAGYAYHSELVAIPKNLAVKVPDNVDLEEAAFTTLGAIALQGIRQANCKIGENVVVIGLGLIGLITVQLLKANGCRVIGFDINEKNFKLAKEYGCDFVSLFNDESISFVESFTYGYGADSVIITASTRSNEPIERAIEFSRKKGRIVLVGVSGMNIPRKGFYEKELEFTISCSYGPGRYDLDYELKGLDYPIGYVRFTEKRNMETILQLLSQGRLSFKPLITHRFNIQDSLKAYDLITGKKTEHYIGIVIKYRNDDLKSSVSVRENELYRLRRVSKIKIGFIGAGNFAQSYLLPNIIKENVELITVSTKTPIHAKSVSEKFNFKFYSTNPEEVINNKEINTIFIATHHDSHGQYVIQALKNNKNVFVEKPLCVTLSELEEIRNLYNSFNDNRPLLMVGFNRRFSKPFIQIKEFFKNRLEPFMISYRVNAGDIPLDHWIQQPEQGGRIIGEGCHFIDIFDFLIESKPLSFYTTSIRSHNVNRKRDDNVIITINYQDGSIANLIYLANGDKSMPKEYCEIFCSGKCAIMNDFKEVIFYQNNNCKKIKYKGDKGHKEEIEHFISSITNESNIIYNWDIFTTTEITIRASDKSAWNRVIEL